MQDINQTWRSLHSLISIVADPSPETLTSVPPLLWSSFHMALQPFLDYRLGFGGMLVLRWSHKLLEKVADNLFLSSGPKAHAVLNKLADYFGGKLYDGKPIQQSVDKCINMHSSCMVGKSLCTVGKSL